MKRKIFFWILFVIEVALVALYFTNESFHYADGFTFITDFFASIKYGLGLISNQLPIPLFKDLPIEVKNIIVLLVLTIVFFVLYFIITSIIANVSKKIRHDTIVKSGHEVVLDESQNAQFSYKLYYKNFPIRRIISLIIPLGIIALFFLIRFDKEVCLNDPNYEGYFYISPALKWIEATVPGLYWGLNVGIEWYLNVSMNLYSITGALWIEWGVVIIIALLILAIWLAFFSIFSKSFATYKAKQRADGAKARYLSRLEKAEMRIIKAEEKNDEKSKKVMELFGDSNVVDENEIEAIAISSKEEKNISSLQFDYLDDIAKGVTDLGVVETDDEELHTPLLTRDTSFVEDGDIEIKLVKEPIIETIEEEEEYFDNQEEIEEVFERYNNEDIPDFTIENKIKKYNIDILEDDENNSPLDNIIAHIKEYHDPVIPSESNFKFEEDFEPTIQEEKKVEELANENMKLDYTFIKDKKKDE